MQFSISHVSNAKPLVFLRASCSTGIGLITAIITFFGNLFGITTPASNKVDKSATRATKKIVAAAEKHNADGIMDVRYEVSGLTVFVYGTAFAYDKDSAPAKK